MSYFDDASLVFIPSGYKTSKAYSVKPIDGSGDLTFTRSNDTATRVNSAGLIEKVRTNLLLQSNGFDTASWTKSGAGTGLAPVVTANAGTAPDGTNNAFRVQFNCVGTTSSDRSILNQSRTSVNSTPHTSSVYIKAFSAGEVGKQVRFITESNGSQIIITLTADWQRVVNVGTSVATSLNFLLETRGSVTANTTADVLLAFAQLETGDIATQYIPTTSAAVSVGPVANVPRLDYLNSSCPKLILEGQRTNLFTNSEDITQTDWVKYGGVTVTANNTASPDGYLNADKMDSTGGIYTQKTFTAGTAYAISVFIKKDTATLFRINYVDQSGPYRGGEITYTFATRAIAVTQSANTSVSGEAVDYGNGWIRLVLKMTANAAANYPYQSFDFDGGTGWVWGFQMEAGAYPSSYIGPTLGAAVTRGADLASASYTGLTTTSGSLFIDLNKGFAGQNINSGVASLGLRLSSTGTNDSVGLRDATSGTFQGVMRVGGTSSNLGAVISGTAATKVCFVWTASTVKMFKDGALFGSASISTPAVFNTIELPNATRTVSAPLSQFLIFPTALSDADAIALTA